MPIKYDNNKLRQPGLNLPVTPEQLSEIVKCSKDVKYFAGNYYKVIHPKKGEMIMSLYEYQREMLDHFQKNMSSVVCSARQMGKALHVDTQVLTPNGYVRLGDLKVGDIIYGGDGQETIITYVTDIFLDRVCFILKFDTGENIIACEDHLWRVIIDGIEQIRTTAELFGSKKEILIKNPAYIDIKPFGKSIDKSHTRIFSIEEHDSVPVKCLQVNNPTHTFLVGKTNIPTHNTTCSSLYLLWYAIFNEKKTLAILANKQDTAASTIDDIKKAYEGLPLWLKPGVTVYNNLSIEFENGTRIFARATSENALRGESVSVLFLDEFAFIDNNLMEKFWPSNYPTIAANKGQIIIVSTPNGAAGKFYELYNEALNYENKDTPFRAVTFPWTLHPDKDEGWKKDMLATMTEVQFRQEFECSFAGSTYTLINGDTLSALKKITPIEIRENGKYQLWDKPKRGHVYAFGIDSAAGNGNDYSVINIYDITQYVSKGKYKLVGLYRCNDTNIFDFAKIAYKMAQEWFQPVIIAENNESGLGNILGMQIYNEFAYERMYYDYKLSRVGVNANVQTKKLATTYFKQDLESGNIEITSANVIDELLIYEEKESRPGIFSAKRGRNYHDDCVVGGFWVSFLLRTEWFDSLKEEIYSKALLVSDNKTAIAQQEEMLRQQEVERYDADLGSLFLKKLSNRRGTINSFDDEMWADG